MSAKDKALEILLSAEDFVSGETIAEKLGISRTAVWKMISELRSDGLDIEAVTNKGYKIVSEGRILSETVIRKYLTENRNRNMYVLKSVDSTNNYAKKLAAEGAESGTLVTADMQTAGKGRMGRSFNSPAGSSVYMSVILRPGTDMHSSQLITSCIAAAVADAVDRVCGTDVKIKWVNDLFLGGKKICGILTEASVNFEAGGLDYAVAGIGINVSSVKEIFPPELLEVATSIEDETGKLFGRSRIIAKVLDNIDKYMENIENGGFLEEYRSRSFIVGKRISVMKYGGERPAQAVGISGNAGLVVLYDDGTQEILNSGEARILPV